MDKFEVLSESQRVDYFHEALENSIHDYIDERELVLWEDIDLDVEVFREVSALFRVIKRLSSDTGVKPMPDVIKRLFYLKREIYQQRRAAFEQSKFTTKVFLSNSRNFR